jgi:hypothetical protein
MPPMLTSAQSCRDLLTDLGPCFIKAGQVLANRPDIIRQDYMEELCVLQDDVPSFPDDIAFQIIEENLGCPMEEALSAISEHPVAAASLGQVRTPSLRASALQHGSTPCSEPCRKACRKACIQCSSSPEAASYGRLPHSAR